MEARHMAVMYPERERERERLRGRVTKMIMVRGTPLYPQFATLHWPAMFLLSLSLSLFRSFSLDLSSLLSSITIFSLSLLSRCCCSLFVQSFSLALDPFSPPFPLYRYTKSALYTFFYLSMSFALPLFCCCLPISIVSVFCFDLFSQLSLSAISVFCLVLFFLNLTLFLREFLALSLSLFCIPSLFLVLSAP